MKFRLVSAVAAAVVLVAACGSSHSSTTLRKLPVEASLDGDAALGAPSGVRGADTGDSMPAGFATIEYRLGGPLAPLPATAPAYDVAAGPAQHDRHRIATALALADSDRHLFLSSGAWWYDANCEAPQGVDVTGAGGPDQAVGYSCASAAISVPAVGGACDGGPTTECIPDKPTEPERPSDLPSKEAATDRARSLFHSIGVDVSVDELHVTDGITQLIVTADPNVEGLATTGRTVSATIGPNESILAASGFSGTPTKLGDYPLVDAATIGFTRLLEQEAHRPRPMSAMAMPCRADVPNCGEPLTPQVVTITGVHLALQQLGAMLVPVLVFKAGPNVTAPPVPAVIDDLLQTTTPTTPTIPESAPSEPPTAVGGTPTKPG